MLSKIKPIIMLTTMLLCVILSSCGEDQLKAQSFTESNFQSTRIRQYAVVNDISCIKFSYINENNRLDSLSNVELPVLSLYDYSMYSVKSDGVHLYMNGRYFGFDENDELMRKKIIFKINIADGTVIPLVYIDSLSKVRNNDSLNIHDNYLYFFLEKEDSLNDVCRVSLDGGDIEILTNNTDDIYIGVFFADNGKTYYNGKFYCTMKESGDLEVFDPDAPDETEKLNVDICSGRYLIKDEKIYYVKYIPLVIGYDTENGLDSINTTQGKVFVYDIATGKDKLLVENSELDVLSILDVNDEVVLVHANTNDAILGYNLGNGEGTYWYMRIKDGEIFEITQEEQ